jgi:2-iminoacetate synthase
MLLYAPLYVSSQCVNYCLYCGFRYPLDILRKQLTVEEAVEQAGILRERGFRHLLVVGGDFPSRTTPAYYREIITALVREGLEPGIEIAPQTTAAYAELVTAGVCGLTLYQETYDEELYARYHMRGPKSSYHWRLESHDRAAEAGMPRLGFGILLGLAEPRADLTAMMRHAAYLVERFPDRRLAFSLPRIHEAPKEFQIPYPVSDDDLIRLYCALRIAYPEATLVLSTREAAELRNRLARICITQMSAGSCTSPGGYRPGDEPTGEQFPVADHRSPAEVAAWLRSEGFEVHWSFE